MTLREPFTDPARQAAADRMGMFVFLATEVMLFGGILAVALTDRIRHPEAVIAASSRLDLWLGAINTVVLLTSSLAMAIAAVAARQDRRRATLAAVLVTAALGLAFLGLKSLEYAQDYAKGLLPALAPPATPTDPAQALFLNLYLVATALHAVHLTIGIGLVLWLAIRIARRRPAQAMAAELTGLYWHFVDIVWVFLYPVLYLVR
ncbi:cytochrome c oxidase polypeptide III [Inquilinus limosus MP06]|uniref:Cytochrome c oxidase polypeptide III n=1 Tax=Inquilinus limosus MP06 TaxID=1398085 RepID=A0A0A0DBS2_9PROT|nr:cytochrome c oxidase polypeptide III [Inquilinus limosus MP06]